MADSTIVQNTQRGAYHIANNKVEYNPQRKYNFTLLIRGLSNIPRMGSVENASQERDLITDGQQEIIIALKSCDTPKITQSSIDINRGNSIIHFPGKPKFSDINFEAYDYIGSNVKDTLYAWQNQSYNTRYDYIGKASGCKKTCQLIEYTPDGEMVRYWEIKGAWLSTVDAGDFNMEDDGVATVKATMVIDWAEMHLPDDYQV